MNRRYMKGYRHWADIFVIAAVVFILVGVPVIGHLMDKATCHRRANLMQMNATHSVMLGCMVKVGERWVPLHYVRINQNGDISIVPGDEE